MRCSALWELWTLVVLSRVSTSNAFALSYSTTANTGYGVSEALQQEEYSKPLRSGWEGRVRQLVEYREEHGHTLVPRRYPENPALGNWVNKQRQLYRKYLAKETPCSLTPERIELLNSLGFCWDASPSARPVPLHDAAAWWKKLEEYQTLHASAAEKLPSSMAFWIRRQRLQYDKYRRGEKCKLDEEKVKALDDINPDWCKSARQCRWEARLKELVAYREAHGDCCVPISYENKKLANWVSNVRKSYNLKMTDRPSTLKSDQIQELNDIGFIWNRWEHEYARQLGGDMMS